MTTQYTPTLKLALPVTGELSGTWGDVVNDNITSMIEQAIAGLSTINTWTANAHTLTTANGTTSESRCAMLVAATGAGGTALTGVGEIICPSAAKLYVVQNTTAFVITLKTSAGTGVAVAAGDTAFLFCDATNVNSCVTTIVNGNITGNLTVGGNATINGNTTLGNATSDTITATARFASDLVPSTDNARDLGSAANSWRSLWIDGTATMALVAITGGTIDGVSIGSTTAATIINVDNLRLDGNTISSTDTNGNVVIAPNGTGDVQLDADTVRVGDSAAAATLTSNGAGALTVTTGGTADLTLSTNAGVNSGTVVIANGVNGNITLTPNGTGDVILSADRVQMGDSNTDTTLTTNGTGNLNLTTNDGTNSGTIQIAQGINGNITLTPNGTGSVSVPKLVWSNGTTTRVPYLTTGGQFTDSANLTFSGTSLSTTQIDITAQGTLRLQDTTGGEYVALRAPATLAANYTLTFPADDGTSGQALVTDGAGVLSWSTAASGDVYGPGSATDNALARFDTTTGKLIQNSVGILSDAGVLTGLTGLTSSGSITLSSLTAGRVTFASTAGLLTDSANLTWDGSALAVTGALSASGVATPLSITPTGNAVSLSVTQGTDANAVRLGAGGNVSAYLEARGYLGVKMLADTSTIGNFSSTGLAVTGTISSNNGSANNLLSINGDGAIQSGVQFKANNAGPYTTIYFDNATNHTYYKNLASGGHLFFNNTTQAMTLIASGNLGVGETSPLAKLNVSGGTTIASLTDWNSKANTVFTLANAAVRLGFGYDANDQPLIQGFDSTNNARPIGLQIYGGNVGIGTASPSAKLDVKGAANAVALNVTNVAVDGNTANLVEIQPSNGAYYGKLLKVTSGRSDFSDSILFLNTTSGMNSTNGSYMRVQNSASADIFRIDGAGNVGIGTTSPGSILDVRDAIGATRVTVTNTANAAAGAGINFLVKNGATTVGNSTIRVDNADNLQFFNISGERARITSYGNLNVDYTSNIAANGTYTSSQVVVKNTIITGAQWSPDGLFGITTSTSGTVLTSGTLTLNLWYFNGSSNTGAVAGHLYVNTVNAASYNIGNCDVWKVTSRGGGTPSATFTLEQSTAGGAAGASYTLTWNGSGQIIFTNTYTGFTYNFVAISFVGVTGILLS